MTLRNMRNQFILEGRESPVDLRRSNYMTNSELEYAVKKDMGSRVEPYGLVPAMAQKQRRQGLKYLDTGNSRLDFLARQLDLVTAELNESIGRVSHKKLKQIMEKLNVLRSQFNLARYEEEIRPKKQALQEMYSPRNLTYTRARSPRPATSVTRTKPLNDTQDDMGVLMEMRKQLGDDGETSVLQRADSFGNIRQGRKGNFRSDYSTEDVLNEKDPLVDEYFPATSQYQNELFSTEQGFRIPPPRRNIRPSSAIPQDWQPSPLRSSYDPSKYESNALTTGDIVDIAEGSHYDPSAFQLELLRLKAEKLQLEEEALLEMRRLSEIEKLRGPRHRWYELKNPNFWYEAAKNNDQLRQSYDDTASINYLRQYRRSLNNASVAFRDRWSSINY